MNHRAPAQPGPMPSTEQEALAAAIADAIDEVVADLCETEGYFSLSEDEGADAVFNGAMLGAFIAMLCCVTDDGTADLRAHVHENIDLWFDGALRNCDMSGAIQ